MRRLLRLVSVVVLLLLAALAGFGVWRCGEDRQWLFAGLYGALGVGCLGMVAASVWPDRRLKEKNP